MVLNRRAFLKAAAAGTFALSGASLLAACTSPVQPSTAGSSATGASQEAVTIIYWDWWSPTESPIYANLFDYVNEEFEKTVDNIVLEVQHVPFGEYVQKFQAAHAAGNPPDVMHASRNWARDFYDKGLLSDMAPFQEMTPDLAETTFLPGSLVQAKKGEVLYGIPGEGPDSMQIFYNMDMFEQAEIDPSMEAVKAWTWDDFVANAKKLTKYDGDNVDVAGFLISTPWVGDSQSAWAGTHGGSFYKEEQKGVAFNDNDAMVHGLELWLRLLYDEKVSPALSPDQQELQIFMQKKSAMAIDGPWSFSTVQSGAPDIKLGVMILPAWTGEGGKPSTSIWNNMLCIPEKSAHADEGWTFLSWWCGLDFMLARLKIGDWLAPRKDFYETSEYKAKREANPVLDSVPYASEMGTSAPYTQLSAMEPILRTANESVMLRQAQPAEATAQAVDQCNKILADAGYA